MTIFERIRGALEGCLTQLESALSVVSETESNAAATQACVDHLLGEIHKPMQPAVIQGPEPALPPQLLGNLTGMPPDLCAKAVPLVYVWWRENWRRCVSQGMQGVEIQVVTAEDYCRHWLGERANAKGDRLRRQVARLERWCLTANANLYSTPITSPCP